MILQRCECSEAGRTYLSFLFGIMPPGLQGDLVGVCDGRAYPALPVSRDPLPGPVTPSAHLLRGEVGLGHEGEGVHEVLLGDASRGEPPEGGLLVGVAGER